MQHLQASLALLTFCFLLHLDCLQGLQPPQKALAALLSHCTSLARSICNRPPTVINLYCKLASFFNPVVSTPTPSFVKHFCSGRKLSPYSSLLGVLFFLKAFYIVSKITHFQFLVVGSALKDVRLHFLLSSTSLHFSLSTETQVQSLPCLVRHKVLNSC